MALFVISQVILTKTSRLDCPLARPSGSTHRAKNDWPSQQILCPLSPFNLWLVIADPDTPRSDSLASQPMYLFAPLVVDFPVHLSLTFLCDACYPPIEY